jgi:YVTN family beta-propeller protein
VAVGISPKGVAVNPNTNHIYVANYGSDSVSVIDGTSNTVVATVAVGIDPWAVAVNPNTNLVYVANEGSDNVSVIDGANNTVVATVALGTDPRARPRGVAVNPSTNRIYVANWNGYTVSVIDGASNTIVTNVWLGTDLNGVAVNPNADLIYATRTGNYDVAVIDGTSSAVVHTVMIVTARPWGVAVNPSTNRVYVTTLANKVSVIDGASNEIVATVTVGNTSKEVAVNANTNRIYVTTSTTLANRDVDVIDGASNTVIAEVTAGSSASGVAVNPNTSRIYVTNTPGGTVSIIVDCPDGSCGDDDGDGLPNSYEDAHACLNRSVLDSGADPDEGGLTNLQEYQYGTDPCALPACNPSPNNQLSPCDMQRGDILLSHGLGPLYVAQEALFNGYWTHAGLYVGDGVIAESSGRIDCTPWWEVWTCLSPEPGVQTHRIEDTGFWTASDWAILRPTASTGQRDGASSYAVNQTGKDYNWWYLDKETEGSFYCSQLVWRAYETQGIDLDSNLSSLGVFYRTVLWLGPWGTATEAGVLAAVPPDDIYFDADATVVKQRPGVGAWVRRTLLRLLSPGDLYITDPQGRHTGVDPVTGEVAHEIPRAFYSGPDVEPQFISVEDASGPWQVQIVGNETGPYTLAGEQIDTQDHGQPQAEGYIDLDAVDSYVSSYAQTPAEGLDILIDSDGDGIADSYEGTHACLDADADDSSLDPDADTLSSLTEYRLYFTDPCVADTDSDSVLDGSDNCPLVHNPGQADGDGDGVGDACESSAAVGGIAELPDLAGSSTGEAGVPPAGESDWSAGSYAALAGGLAAAVLIVAGAWYARRRRAR